ncbi:MAG: pyridoxamine 5'-phosphate oxidase [Bacteroidetes bacterium]|nr:MAG: pyridoxamine 5'-phosphate oxidase [Bacteroidota bacterium]
MLSGNITFAKIKNLMELSDLRRDFGKYKLIEMKLPDSPILMFRLWLEEVKVAGLDEFNAMVVSTVGRLGKPSSRIVLLKEITAQGGLVFYTNYLSRKGRDLEDNPFVSFHFFWTALERQVIIEGKLRKTSAKKSEDYFNSRPIESRLSAIISPQSETILSLKVLENRRNKLLQNPAQIKRPKNWGGYELTPELFEFWQGGKHRLHDRLRYRLMESKWKIDRLAP